MLPNPQRQRALPRKARRFSRSCFETCTYNIDHHIAAILPKISVAVAIAPEIVSMRRRGALPRKGGRAFPLGWSGTLSDL
jgi:hypothetical protein